MDTVDADLVAALRANGRASYAELGRQVGLSGPSVQERVRRLEERGIIEGYRAIIDPGALGLGLTALIGLVLSDSARPSKVADQVEDVDEAEDCWYLAGHEAFVVKARVGDLPELERLVDRLTQIDGVARAEAQVVVSTRFEGRQAPVDPARIIGGK